MRERKLCAKEDKGYHPTSALGIQKEPVLQGEKLVGGGERALGHSLPHTAIALGQVSSQAEPMEHSVSGARRHRITES